eukprot:5363869-Prymnesium_polylepis.1
MALRAVADGGRLRLRGWLGAESSRVGSRAARGPRFQAGQWGNLDYESLLLTEQHWPGYTRLVEVARCARCAQRTGLRARLGAGGLLDFVPTP